MAIHQGMENTSERPKARDTSTLASITDGASEALFAEVDKLAPSMLGARGSSFSVARAEQTDAAQQSALDKAKDHNIYASVFQQQGKGAPKWNSMDQRMEDIIAA